MDSWTEYGKTWSEFCQEIKDRVGLVIQVNDSDRPDVKLAHFLIIGNINIQGGQCDCCGLDSESVVVRYKRVFDNLF